MSIFELHTKYQPSGDQPKAIQELVEGLNEGRRSQVLLGVTGSGKTFTMSNVIREVEKPTLIISPNKTLAAQLYGEFRGFLRIMLLSSSFHITTITSQRPTSLPQTFLLKRIFLSMTR